MGGVDLHLAYLNDAFAPKGDVPTASWTLLALGHLPNKSVMIRDVESHA
jgi:hypothetical protein